MFKTKLEVIVIQAESVTPIETGVIFWSHDKGTAKLMFQLKKDNINQSLSEGTIVPICLDFYSTTAGNGKGRHIYHAVIEDALNGIVSIKLEDNILGYQGRVNGSIYIELPDRRSLDTAGRFTFEIRRSPIDETIPELEDYYWQGFTEIIEQYHKTINEIKTESAKLLEDLIADMVAFLNDNKGDFNDWMAARKEEFDSWRKNQESNYLEWFESIKHILESVDPGGLLLKEILNARVDLQDAQHDSISERLFADLEYIYNKVKHQLDLIVYKNIPSGYRVIIEHDSEYQPDIKVTYYKNSIDTETDGFDTSNEFGGGTIFKVPVQLSYDRKKAYVEMPLFYALTDGEFLVQDENTLVIIQENKVLNFSITGAKISTAYYDDREPETVRIPRELELLVLDDATVQLNWKRGVL